jgi:hypothetical protein
MTRFYGYLWERSDLRSLSLLPRLRLATGSSVGLGFQFLTTWLHVWLWRTEPVRQGRMIELLPHVWIHWHRRWGAGVHLQWIVWRTHFWFYQPAQEHTQSRAE